MVRADAVAAPDARRLADPQRLAALHRLDLLDTPPDEAFDRLARLAAAALDVPIALVSLVDADRQFFKSQVGLREPWASRRETPLSHSFCKYAVAAGAPLVIDDARAHPLVRGSPAIEALGVVAYAGIPLVTPEGHALGTLCAIDTAPRAWTVAQVATLGDLAACAMTEIELRRVVREHRALLSAAAGGSRSGAG
jgi:GAF domain-containing protein